MVLKVCAQHRVPEEGRDGLKSGPHLGFFSRWAPVSLKMKRGLLVLRKGVQCGLARNSLMMEGGEPLFSKTVHSVDGTFYLGKWDLSA